MLCGVAVTMKDVADAAGVSTATVSRVLSGRRPVSADVADLVRATSQRLGYQANMVARSLRMRSTGTVGMVVPRISNPFFPSMVEAVERELAVGGLQLLLCDSQGSLDHEFERVRALLNRRVDGLLLIPCEAPGSSAAVAIATASVPVILLDRTTGVDLPASTDVVSTDDDLGMALLFDHLRQRGVASTAFVSATDISSSAFRRREGYQTRTTDAGSSTRLLLGDFSYEWGREAAQLLLAGGPLPDAVVCGADIIALGVLSAFHAARVSVPGDILVTGYDDIGFAALSNPGLTTVRQPVEAMGRTAVQLLTSRLRDARDGLGRHELLDPDVVVRESTGP